MSDDRCDLLCLDLQVAERLRKKRLAPDQADVAAGKARALSDPTRLMLAAALLEASELCVCDLAWYYMNCCAELCKSFLLVTRKYAYWLFMFH